MAKLTNFEDLLGYPFRWPRQGDRLFQPGVGSADNAELQADADLRLAALLGGYKLAADLLVDRSIEFNEERNLLVYPIIFSYRHFIELSLKYLLDKWGNAGNAQANWQSHNLTHLWTAFYDMLINIGTDDPDEADGIIAAHIVEFAKLDPGSFSMRYPTTTKGEVVSFGIDELDLAQLKEVMQSVENFFRSCDAYWEEMHHNG